MFRRARGLMGLVVALLAALSATQAAELPILDPARVTATRLNNGLRVVVKEERQWPVVAIGVYVRAGSVHEGSSEVGAAHMVEHLLFEATGPDKKKLAPYIESLGGRIRATTLRDFMHLDVVVASSYLEQVLPVIVKAVYEARFEEREFARERDVVQREIGERSNRADIYLDDLLWRSAFKTHPYGRPIGGTTKDVAQLTVERVREFYQRTYVPGNMAFVVVGDVEPAWLQGRLGELTAPYRAPAPNWELPPSEPPLSQPRVVAESLPREITLMGFAWQAPGIADKSDVCAMDLIYTLLGQGSQGRLMSELGEQKKVLLSAEVQYLTQRQPGLLTITALLYPAREDEALAGILAQVRRLAEEPISEAELARARRMLYTDYAFTNESYDDQVGSMGFYESIDTYQFALDYIAEVMRITPEQIQATARKYLLEEAYTLVILRGKRSGQPEVTAMRP